MSVAKPKTTTNQASTVNTSNLNVQDTDGITLAGSNNNTLNITDGGAFSLVGDVASGAFGSLSDVSADAFGTVADVSSDALSLGRAAIDSSNDGLSKGLGYASDVYTSSLSFGRDITSDAIESIADSARSTTDALRGSQSDAFDFGGNVVSGLFDFVDNSFNRFTNATSDLAKQSIAGNQSLAKSTSESADDRVTRLGMYAFLAIGAILVLPAIFGKK
jgi:hypothetical protein